MQGEAQATSEGSQEEEKGEDLMKLTKTTGMRLRMSLGDGTMTSKTEGTIKFWLSYDNQGLIVELEEGGNPREYFIFSYRDMVDEVISRRFSAEYDIDEALIKENEKRGNTNEAKS